MGALSGVRVVEFALGVAMSYATKYMALLGAEVVKVESRKKLDSIRDRPAGITVKPMVGVGYETTFANEFNVNKLGVTLDLSNPEAVEVSKKIVAVSDVAVENMRPGVMDRMGLGYAQLSQVNPSIIMAASSQAGHDGPEAMYAGYAAIFTSLAGLGHVTGYPDGAPTEIRMPADVISAATSAYALVVALIYRRRTGKGQYIDVSSRDAISCLIGDALLEYTANGRVRTRHGNVDSAMAPHNCYRCRGVDKWVSIAVATDGEWDAFRRAIGEPEWSRAPRFSDADGRWRTQEELDRLIQAWTIERTHYEVMGLLQPAGVAAVPSFNAKEICEDPHLQDRGLLHDVQHPLLGKQTVFNAPWKLSDTPAEITGHGPMLGEHNQYVFGDMLGMSCGEIEGMVARGVLY